MMDGMTTLKIELGISAQKLTQNMMVNNQMLEESIGKAIQKGLDEFCEQENFQDIIKDQTKKELLGIVERQLFSWDIQQKLQSAIKESIEVKLKEHADQIAKKLIDVLDKK